MFQEPLGSPDSSSQLPELKLHYNYRHAIFLRICSIAVCYWYEKYMYFFKQQSLKNSFSYQGQPAGPAPLPQKQARSLKVVQEEKKSEWVERKLQTAAVILVQQNCEEDAQIIQGHYRASKSRQMATSQGKAKWEGEIWEQVQQRKMTE